MEQTTSVDDNQATAQTTNNTYKIAVVFIILILFGMVIVYFIQSNQPKTPSDSSKKIINQPYPTLTVYPTQPVQSTSQLFDKTSLKIARADLGKLFTFEDDQKKFIQEYLTKYIIKETPMLNFTCTPTYSSNYVEYEKIGHYLDDRFFMIDYEKRSWDDSYLSSYKITDPLLLDFIEQKNTEISRSVSQLRLVPTRIDEIALFSLSNGKKLISYVPSYLFKDSNPGPAISNDLIVSYLGEQELYIADDDPLSICLKQPNAITDEWMYFTCSIGDGLGIEVTLERINVHSSAVEKIFSCSAFYETEEPQYKCDITIE